MTASPDSRTQVEIALFGGGLGLLSAAAGVGLYALAHLPASLSSVSLLIQPLTATIAAWALLHESMGPWQMTGGVLLLWGIYLSKKGS